MLYYGNLGYIKFYSSIWVQGADSERNYCCSLEKKHVYEGKQSFSEKMYPPGTFTHVYVFILDRNSLHKKSSGCQVSHISPKFDQSITLGKHFYDPVRPLVGP